MQIQRLKNLENFEGIKSCPEEVDFLDFNIVFGDNGSGKSRVVRAIKTFVENRPIEKHYFYPTDPSKISLEIDSTQYTLDDSHAYSPNEPPDIENSVSIFDKDFIENNLKITPDEQGNKIISIAGFDLCSNMITAFEQVVDSIKEIRYNSYATNFTTTLQQIKSQLPSSQMVSAQINEIKFGDFTKKGNWNAKKHIEAISKIHSSITKLSTLSENEVEELQKEKDDLNTRIESFVSDKQNLEKFLSFKYDFGQQAFDSKSLTKSIAVFQNAISKLSELDKYTEDQIEFIKLGVKLLKDSSNCPFCLQDLTNQQTQTQISNYKSLVKSLTVDAKQTFLDELDGFINTLDNIPSAEDINFKDYVVQFNHIKKIVTDATFSIWKVKSISTKHIESLKSNLNQIRSNVEHDKVKSIEQVDQHLLGSMYDEIKIINQTIAANKSKFSINKPLVQNVYDKDYIKGIGALMKKRDKVAKEIEEDKDKKLLKGKLSVGYQLIANLKEVEKIDTLIENIRALNNNFTKQLVSEMDKFGKEYGELLQKYYKHFYPNGVFDYIDWSSKTTKPAGLFRYKVGISAKNTLKRSKDGRKPEDVLSEGNYNALSLAYFFSICDKMDPSIIIFDDPITGMDSAKRLQLIRLILELFNKKQVFVFTHDVLFKSYLCDAIPEHIKLETSNINENLTHTRFYNVFLSDDILKFLPNQNIYAEILNNLRSLATKPTFTDIELHNGYGCLRLGLEYFLHKKLIRNIPNLDGFSSRLREYRKVLNKPLEEADRITLKNIHLACSKTGPHLDSTGGDSVTNLKRLIQDFLQIDAKFN
jgi:energy-coupling factor transporter ATP-binding protein EcfA2